MAKIIMHKNSLLRSVILLLLIGLCLSIVLWVISLLLASYTGNIILLVGINTDIFGVLLTLVGSDRPPTLLDAGQNQKRRELDVRKVQRIGLILILAGFVLQFIHVII